MAPIRGVLLDVDGTLLDSNEAHARAWKDALEGVGWSFGIERIRRLIGKGSDRILRELVGINPESREGRSIEQKRIALLKTFYLPDLEPTPGARELVLR